MHREENVPEKKKKKSVPVWSWMLTLLPLAIPGVNIITCVVMLFACRSASKRSMAAAALILNVIVCALIVAAFLIFGEQLAEFGEWLKTAPGIFGK